jgi:hypothetical protein
MARDWNSGRNAGQGEDFKFLSHPDAENRFPNKQTACRETFVIFFENSSSNLTDHSMEC